MKNLICVGLVVLTAGCAAPSQQTPVATEDAAVNALIQKHKNEDSKKSCQRFVLIGPPESNRTGIPWHGFFALDTETGQLCRTSPHELNAEYQRLPTCVSLSQATSAPNSGFQKF